MLQPRQNEPCLDMKVALADLVFGEHSREVASSDQGSITRHPLAADVLHVSWHAPFDQDCLLGIGKAADPSGLGGRNDRGREQQ